MAGIHKLVNKWIQPYDMYGPCEANLRREMIHRTDNYSIDFKTWESHANKVDKFLDKVFAKINENMVKYKDELIIEPEYIRQGSARQGLKIYFPDEYDIIVPMHVKGIKFERPEVRNDEGNVVSGYHKLKVTNKNVEETHPHLIHDEVIQGRKDNLYLNAECLHKKLLTGVVDKALDSVKKENPHEVNSMGRIVHPPSVNPRVKSKSQEETSFDIVPGICLGSEKIVIPSQITGEEVWNVSLPIYAVPKYASRKCSSFQNEDRPFLFRIDTSSYERCIADLCGSMKERQYIMTANRILKARLQTLRDKKNSLALAIDSYHLKTIAYSVIYEETMRTPSKIAGVAEAFDLQILELN